MVISLSLISAAFLEPSQPKVKLTPPVINGLAKASPQRDWIPAKLGITLSQEE